MSEAVVGPGTGSALSRRFAADGYRVAMLARDPERLAALEREIGGSRGYAVDVTDVGRVKEVLDRIHADMGAPGVLVHNAVSGHFAEFLEVAPADLERTLRTNVLSRPDDFFARPDAIAETVYHVVHQDRSAWTFEVDLRPFREKW